MEKHPTNRSREEVKLKGESDDNRLQGRIIQSIPLPIGTLLENFRFFVLALTSPLSKLMSAAYIISQTCTLETRVKRVYLLVGTVLLWIILLRQSWIPCLRYGKSRTYGDSRLLRFSTAHQEWVPSAAIEYLLSMRDIVDDEGNWAGVKPAGIDVMKLRGDGSGLLDGVSDDAIRALAGREGYRVGYLDVTDSSDGDTSLLWPNPAEEVVNLPYDAVDPSVHPEYKDLIKMVSVDELKYIIGNLSTNFRTRHFRSLHARGTQVIFHLLPLLWYRDIPSPEPPVPVATGIACLHTQQRRQNGSSPT
jgi:hypothetical protein